MNRHRWLQIALVAIGLVALLFYPLMHLWPAGWVWSPGQREYELMMAGFYATLGVFLLLAARAPERHTSLIWFTAWSSAVHGGIMIALALRDPTESGHLAGDIPALLIAAVVLSALAPRRSPSRHR